MGMAGGRNVELEWQDGLIVQCWNHTITVPNILPNNSNVTLSWIQKYSFNPFVPSVLNRVRLTKISILF